MTVRLAATVGALALVACQPHARRPLPDHASVRLSSVFLEDFTWTELRDAISGGRTTIILPVGGVEQSGPVIALGKHDARVRVLSERIARQLGDAL
ncbi:MAG: creatininase family protein, partial [Caulobacteraceae bacterium]|nr:creatininase family protein [Caulobacteraceae bacterium]